MIAGRAAAESAPALVRASVLAKAAATAAEFIVWAAEFQRRYASGAPIRNTPKRRAKPNTKG